MNFGEALADVMSFITCRCPYERPRADLARMIGVQVGIIYIWQAGKYAPILSHSERLYQALPMLERFRVGDPHDWDKTGRKTAISPRPLPDYFSRAVEAYQAKQARGTQAGLAAKSPPRAADQPSGTRQPAGS